MNNISYKKAEIFNGIKGLSHGFFNREGGFSLSPFDSLNISFDVGDNMDDVIKNRKIIMSEFSMNKLVAVNQVHGLDSYIPGISEGDPLKIEKDSNGADIIISNKPGQLLMIKTADCQPVLIVDEEKRVCCGIHSGWKGSVSNVICIAIDKMTETYGCTAKDMKAAIGPSLGPCCGEFVNYKKEIPQKYWPYRVGEYHFDFWEISRYQLITAGLKEKNIWLAGSCTKCGDGFFSYRNDKKTGRQASVIGWID